jgi:hypothetical protein
MAHQRFVPTDYKDNMGVTSQVAAYPTTTEMHAKVNVGAFRLDSSDSKMKVHIPAGTCKLLGFFSASASGFALVNSGITINGLTDTLTSAPLAAATFPAATLGGSDSSGTAQWSAATDKCAPTVVSETGLECVIASPAASTGYFVLYTLG